MFYWFKTRWLKRNLLQVTLEIFYYDTEEIKRNNKDYNKDLKKRKVVLAAASDFYNVLLNMYGTFSS